MADGGAGGWPSVEPFRIESLSVEVYRAPTPRPVRTSFGTMTDRPAVVVKAQSSGVGIGYGEVWCNFPAPAAEYRASLIRSVLAPLIVGQKWRHPKAVFDHLTAETRILAIQAAEQGPFSQAIAGIDIALWDMVARRAGQPLWRFLGGDRNARRVPVYASGIGPDRASEQALGAAEAGYRAFKLKVGFGGEIDLRNLAGLRRELGSDAPIALDANQAWSPDEAAKWNRALAAYDPIWMEEPIPVHYSDLVWAQLAGASPVPLAGGENLAGEGEFLRAIRNGALAVIQPDVTKWGGISGCLPVAREILGAGRRFCPHFLGGGVGLMATAHLLAAAGGDGLLEIDCNPNPLRQGLAQPFPGLVEGRLELSEAPGLGVVPSQAMVSFQA